MLSFFKSKSKFHTTSISNHIQYKHSSATTPHPVANNATIAALLVLAGPGVTVDNEAVINADVAVNAASTNAVVAAKAVASAITTNAIATNVVAGDVVLNNAVAAAVVAINAVATNVVAANAVLLRQL